MSSTISPAEAENDSRKVEKVRIVVHSLGAAGPTMSDNHWSIYLLLENNQGSVRINMSARPGFIDGNLLWTKQVYLLTNSTIRHWDFSTAATFRVCDIAKHIRDTRRFHYDMSGGGSGCRYWV